jgi:HEAT repeat protein
MAGVRAAVHEAIRRGDLDWLAAHLGADECTPPVLRLLLRHDDPRLRHLGLDRLEIRITRNRIDEPGTAELAGLLPGTLDGPPETALLLARLHQRLWRHVPARRRPDRRATGLPARVQIAWLRARLLNEPETIADEPAGELLHQAVTGLTAAEAPRPDHLVRALAATGDPVLHEAALRVAGEALHGALLSPSRAREHLGGLLDGTNAAVIVAVLRELTEPWAALVPLPRHRLRPHLTSPAADPEVVEAATAAAARHGHRDLLWDVAVDETMPPRARQRALRALGDLSARADIPRITTFAAADPLLFGGPATACLRAMHRRGQFPGGDDAAPIVNLALADHAIAAADVAAVLYTCRREAFHALVAAGTGDPMWRRRLALLTDLALQGGDDLPIGDAITALLTDFTHQTGDRLPIGDAMTASLTDITQHSGDKLPMGEAVTAMPDPAPFLAAIGTLRHLPAEAAVLDMLPRAPAAALRALEAVGGPRTVSVLTEGLGLGPNGAGVIAAHLRAVRHQALELLWHLDDDPGRRQLILARLNPRDLPPRIVADLGGADQRELALLSAGADPGDPVRALVRLARNGDATILPILSDVLLRIVADLVAGRDGQRAADGRGHTDRPGTAAGTDRPTDEPAGRGRTDRPGTDRPNAEPAVPDEVVTALRGLGGRLHERGTLRPYCLRAATDADAAGHALVATIGLDLLDRPGLSDAERVVLLALLRQAPYPGTRARVHRLLRHRDRHVRKHVIALLADSPDAGGAHALSASLIMLAAAPDAPTARQAVLALGRIRARWAAPAIAACLGHPAMNVKKTAAEALAVAGSPAAVPALLFRLGRTDNPGLRAALAGALHAILGDACAATVLAAAEQAGDDRTRELLLDGLGRRLSARAVDALARQGSPVAAALLGMVATGRLRLGSGTVDDLAAQMAAYGVPLAPGRPPTGPDAADDDVDTLVLDGWDTTTARRLLTRELSAGQCERLRPLLADWLRLAESEPAAVRIALQICPAPWAESELQTFGRHAHVLTDALTGAADIEANARARTTGTTVDLQNRTADADVGAPGSPIGAELLEVLEAVAPGLDAARKLDLVIRIRAAAPTAAGRRSVLPLLVGCDAVLTRADVDRALAAARLGPDPWTAGTAVLREAFTPGTTGAPAWRNALEAAARTPRTLAEFRDHDGDGHTISSREKLAALVEVFTSAGDDVRTRLLDWMEALQPIGAPPWTMTENAQRPADTPRTPHDGDLDQPRSAAQRRRLLERLASPDADRRNAAATALRDWPEPAVTQAVLRACLNGQVTVKITAALAKTLATLDDTVLEAGDDVRERAATVACHLDASGMYPLLPRLVRWWEHGGPATRAAAALALRRHREHADTIAALVQPRLDAGAPGFLDLIAGLPLLRTPALEETCRRLRADGRDDLADRLTFVDGPLRGPGAARDDADALAALRQRPAPAAEVEVSREELIDLIRTGHPEQARRALTRLAEAHEDSRPDEGADVAKLLAELLERPEPRLRLHAHRIGRKILDRATYLRQTMVLLDDRDPNLVRSAIRALGYAGYRPAIPAIVGLLTHSHAPVRRTAADALIHIGRPAVPALTSAAGHARPDRRHHYTAVLDRITATAPTA